MERKNHVARATDTPQSQNRESGSERKKGRDKSQGLVVVEAPTVGVDDTAKDGEKGEMNTCSFPKRDVRNTLRAAVNTQNHTVDQPKVWEKVENAK